MSKAKLVVLCGLSRAGKSTYSKEWIKNLDASVYDLLECPHENRVIINADNFRLAIHGQRYAKEAEPLVFTIVDIVIKVMLMQGMTCLIDETNTTEKSIKKWLKLDPNAEFIYLDTNPVVCKERTILSNQQDLIPVIDKMEENLQKMVFGEVIGQHPNQEQFKKAIERIRSESVN